VRNTEDDEDLHFDDAVQTSNIQVGDLVLLWVNKRDRIKTTDPWIGSYRVVKVLGKGKSFEITHIYKKSKTTANLKDLKKFRRLYDDEWIINKNKLTDAVYELKENLSEYFTTSPNFVDICRNYVFYQ